MFEGLDKVEKILEGNDYLVGGRLTEADVRLFVTIVSSSRLSVFSSKTHLLEIRFDPVYVGHFKCDIKTIRNDYPAIHKYVHQQSYSGHELLMPVTFLAG